MSGVALHHADPREVLHGDPGHAGGQGTARRAAELGPHHDPAHLRAGRDADRRQRERPRQRHPHPRAVELRSPSRTKAATPPTRQALAVTSCTGPPTRTSGRACRVNPVLEMTKLIMIQRTFEQAATLTGDSENALANAIRTLGGQGTARRAAELGLRIEGEHPDRADLVAVLDDAAVCRGRTGRSTPATAA
jgi:hypothetical protein